MAEELSEEEQQRRLQKIINQKKKTDLAGLLKAQRDGTLNEYLAADLEKAGLRPSEAERTVVRRSAAAAPASRSSTQRESEDAPAWARAVEHISQTGTSSAQQSTYHVEDELDEDYEGGYDEEDDEYAHAQRNSRPTDSGVPAWLNNKRSSSREPPAPTSARPYSMNLTGGGQQRGVRQEYYDDQYYDDQNPYDYDDNYDDQGGYYDDDQYAEDHRSYNHSRRQAARRYREEEAEYYDDDDYEYEDIDPRQTSPPPAERTLSNPDRVPPPIPASKPVDNESMPAWAAEPESEQKQEAEPVPATVPKPREVDATTLKYAKYLSGVSVLVGMIVFVMVIVDMAVGFKDKSKYFVGIFVMVLSLGVLGFETKTEAFTRFVAEKFGFMFFPLGRFCFNFLIATLCFGLGIAGIIAGCITTAYAFGTAWLMLLYPALPQHIRDMHGVDMFSSMGPIVRKDLAMAAKAATAATAASTAAAASPSATTATAGGVNAV